jgi:hypothetical protein
LIGSSVAAFSAGKNPKITRRPRKMNASAIADGGTISRFRLISAGEERGHATGHACPNTSQRPADQAEHDRLTENWSRSRRGAPPLCATDLAQRQSR